MKLKIVAKIMLVCGVLALSACSTTKHGSGASGMGGDDGSGGAQASGVGQDDSYGDAGGSGRRSSNGRTYYFDYDRSDVRSEDKPAILSNADYLIAHPRAKVTLEGHTDPRGSREYNVALGEHRANAVLEIMKSRGINPAQVRVVSYGAERPAVPGRSEQDYQLDRRVVLVYTRQ